VLYSERAIHFKLKPAIVVVKGEGQGLELYGFQWVQPVQPVQLGFAQPPLLDPYFDFFLLFIFSRYGNIFIINFIF